MIREFLDWLETWAFDEDNIFIGCGKLLLICTIVIAIIAVPLVIWDDSRPSFTLQKREWSCTESHEEWRDVPMGRTVVPQVVSVCDNYRRVR